MGIALPDTLHRGESAPVTLLWSREGGDAAWPVMAHIRLAARDGEPVPKWRRWVLGERGSRLRSGHRPFEAAWPPTGWAPGDTLVDVQALTDFVGLDPGAYRVSVRVLPEPMFTRVSLRDLFRDDDRWQGRDLGEIAVVP
jgi:hypothetical protein